MQKTNLSKGEAMMRARLRSKLGNPQAKRYQKHRTLYYIFAVYSFLLFAVHEMMFASMLLPQGYYVGMQNQRLFFHSNFFVVQAMILFSLTAFVLMLLKKDYSATICQVVAGILLTTNLIQIVIGHYNNKSYMFIAYAIVLLSVYAAVIMLSIQIGQKKRFNQAVQKEYDKIYKKYGESEGTMFSEEQLESLLIAYETALAKGEAPPKSVEL